MNNSNRFNLIDEPWIPIVGAADKASLRDIFTSCSLQSLGGNPVQKLALQKLLQAIAQAAWTPEDEQEWKNEGVAGMAKQCLSYLDKWHDRFYLYGKRPFLQIPAIVDAKVQSFGAVLPEISTGNTTVLTHGQVEQILDDAQKAVLLVQIMGFALGGKKTDNNVILSPGYQGKYNDKGKESNGRAGPAMSHLGLLHSMLVGSSVQETIWLNLFDKKQIGAKLIFTKGLGQAPWEDMPTGEACLIAKGLQESLMGRLVPLSRFVLLIEDGLHYSEGIQYLDHHDGMQDPTTTVDHSKKDAKVLWANPEKRPWRELTSLLNFLSQQKTSGFDCWQLHASIPRLTGAVDSFGVWSGGLRVSSNAGEQYATGQNDMVESRIWLETAVLNQTWFVVLQQEMDNLDKQSKKLYGCVLGYCTEMKVDGKGIVARATSEFWQECERDFPELLSFCGSSDLDVEKRVRWQKAKTAMMRRVYNRACSNSTARQMQAWAKFFPR